MGFFSNIKGAISKVFKPTPKKTTQKTVTAKSLLEKLRPKPKQEKKKLISAKELIEKLKPKKIEKTPKEKPKIFSLSDYKKAKQRQQEQQQPQQTPQAQPRQTQDVSRETFDDGQIRTEDNRTEDTLEFDDANTYIDYLIDTIERVSNQMAEEITSSYYGHVNGGLVVEGLDRASFWLQEAKDLPYTTKEEIVKQFSASNYMERVEDILSMAIYPSDALEDIENECIDIATQIQEIVEGYY